MAKRSLPALAVSMIAVLPSFVAAQTFVLEQGLQGYDGTSDTTIYEDLPENSGGGFPLIFAGKTVSSFRRALIRFDLSSIPASTLIEEASLTLLLDYSGLEAADTDVYTLHRLTAPWGEGNLQNEGPAFGGTGSPAEVGDATWLSSFHQGLDWETPGGDFESIPSASLVIARWNSVTPSANLYEFSSPQMAADVQNWIENPEDNFGWILLGNESLSRSARRFHSSESDTGRRPRLQFRGESGGTGWTLF